MKDKTSFLAAFDEADKARAFTQIATHYYDSNFGSMSKSDLEVLMFTILLNQWRDKGLSCDDYSLSKQLGITQSRVRSLKQKSQLKYPSDNPWQDAFFACIKYARYDDTRKLVKVTVPEVNVLIELRHYIEENGWFDEYQLNPKLFQCPLDMFIHLCNKLEGGRDTLDEDTKKKLGELEKTLDTEEEKSSLRAILSGDLKGGLHSFIKTATKKGLCELIKILAGSYVSSNIVTFLLSVLEK